MEVIERRSKSPSPGTRSSSRLSNHSNISVDSDSATKKRPSSSTRRKSRNTEKENGDIVTTVTDTNGEVHPIEADPVEVTTPETTEEVSDVAVEEDQQNGHENEPLGEEPEVDTTGRDNDSCPEEQEADEEIVVNGEDDTKESTQEDTTTVSPESSDGHTQDESFVTANRTASSTDNDELELSRENGNVEKDEEAAPTAVNTSPEEPSKPGFFGKWTSMFDRDEPKTNGHASDTLNLPQNLYMSVRGRASIRDRLKTPPNKRHFNDSFGVKSEPPRTWSIEEKRNLRKFPGKRCLNNDDEEESSISSLSFTKKKRRVDEENKPSTGFFRNFLWSPFRKLSLTTNGRSDKVAPTEEAPTSTSWFKSPFFFWRKYGNNSNGTAAVNGSNQERN